MSNTTGKQLRYLREMLGLTQQDVALELGYTESSISYAERKGYKTEKARQNYTEFLKNKMSSVYPDIKAEIEDKIKTVPDISDYIYHLTQGQLEEINRKIVRSFEVGKMYRVLNASHDRDFTFEYVKKEGIHHVFREIHGGWSRTYTDTQLIGKNFEEVKE